MNKISFYLSALLLSFGAMSCSEKPVEPVDPEGPEQPQEKVELAVASIEPAAAKAGTDVVISGENFGTEADLLSVTFGRAEAEIKSVADASLTVVVPEGEGEVDVYVAKGEEKAGPLKFTYKVDPKPEPQPEKPVAMWIDAEANFGRLKTKTDIRFWLDKIEKAGFNAIIVDVKPVQGDVLYDSDFLPACTSLGGASVPDRGFDYLQYFIDQAHERGMRITVSTTIFTMGLPQSKTGPGYTDPYWDDKFCKEYLPDGIVDIRETKDWGIFAFLNPVLPEVHDYVIRMVTEICTKYDFDGYALDYCRYQNMNSDFSEASRKAFEKYIGTELKNFPDDIYYYADGVVGKNSYTPGPYYNQWVEWRSSVIQGYIRDIRETVKSIRPDVDIEYWAASWWPLPATGQNWASPNLNSTGSYWWATPNYYKTGFADQLDIFQLGAYLNRVYGASDAESVEYAINRAKRIINGDCGLYGTIQCADKNFDIEEAVYLCLKETDGVMVFELSHAHNTNAWNKIKSGVERAEKELNIVRD